MVERENEQLRRRVREMEERLMGEGEEGNGEDKGKGLKGIWEEE